METNCYLPDELYHDWLLERGYEDDSFPFIILYGYSLGSIGLYRAFEYGNQYNIENDDGYYGYYQHLGYGNSVGNCGGHSQGQGYWNFGNMGLYWTM